MPLTFSPDQLDQLRREYCRLETFDVRYVARVRDLWRRMTTDQIRQIAGARIKFMSPLAANELRRRGAGSTQETTRP